MSFSKLVLLCFVCSFLFQCQGKSGQDQTAPVDSVDVQPLSTEQKAGLPLSNYMRIKDGRFHTGTDDEVPFTSRADLKRTFDHLLTSDSNLVVYFHGGFMSIKKAFSTPMEIKLDSTFRSAGYFPFYVLYGASVNESLWTQRPTNFDEKDFDKQSPDDEQIDLLTSQAVHQKSFIYLLKQIERRVKHKPASLGPYVYTTLDTTDLQLEDLSAGNSFTEQQNEENSFEISGEEERRFIRSLENDKVLARLEQQDAAKFANIKFNGIAPAVPGGKLYRFLRIVGGVFRRMSSGRGHGLFSTCFEETVHTSSGLFLLIKQVVKNGWKRSKQIVEDPFKGDGSTAGGIALLDELVRLDSASRSSGKVRKVFLVGSSTGTILICNLLKKIGSEQKYGNLSVHIVFTVPSCTVVHFTDAIRSAEKNVVSRHIFGLSDNDERSAGIPIVYPGSVLYLASSICESEDKFHDEPLLGLNRFYQSRYTDNGSLKNEQREALKKVKSVFGILPDGRSEEITWSNEQSQNPLTANTARKHSAVIRNTAVQNSISALLSEKMQTTPASIVFSKN